MQLVDYPFSDTEAIAIQIHTWKDVSGMHMSHPKVETEKPVKKHNPQLPVSHKSFIFKTLDVGCFHCN